ncbi:MAG: Ig-like domain-containing protein [Oscillospiraceae bacterium]|nr:Ig-like domain-containing protein [Oscillospiraceae bacterium]
MVRSIVRITTLLCLTACLLALPALAAEPSVYAFSEGDFLLSEENNTLCGIFLTDVPDAGCTMCCSGRILRAGDALDVTQLSQIQLTATADDSMIADVSYLPVYEDGVGEGKTLHIALQGLKNQAPSATDSEVETYKGLAVSGSLRCEDPESGTLTFVLDKEPKYGTVTLHDDGTFTYAPQKNKVGSDSFTYHAEDESGNCSETANVTIHIRKTSSADVFADMQGDSQAFEAMYLRKAGLFSGETIGGTLCFCPEKDVTAGEFLMMVMKLTGLPPEDTLETAVESDDTWFTPWQNAALRAGITSVSDADAAIQKSDAAVLIAGVLDLPAPDTVTVFSDEASYTESACLKAMEEAGLPCFSGETEEPLTRRDAAELLYRVNGYCEENDITFPWN